MFVQKKTKIGSISAIKMNEFILYYSQLALSLQSNNCK